MFCLFLRLETRKIYYFLNKHGALVNPRTVNVPDNFVMELRLRQRLPNLKFYDGFTKIRYRFKFDVCMAGAAFEGDIPSLTQGIHDVWKESVKG